MGFFIKTLLKYVMNCLICLVNEQLVSSCTQLVHYYRTAIWDLGWVQYSKMKGKMQFRKSQWLKTAWNVFDWSCSEGVYSKWRYLILKCFHHFIYINICGRIFTPHFGALWDECSDVDSRRHQSRGPQQAASTRLKSGVVKPFDLNSSFS